MPEDSNLVYTVFVFAHTEDVSPAALTPPHDHNRVQLLEVRTGNSPAITTADARKLKAKAVGED